jgi:glutamate-ammonia-ligase adenylyltransferase
MIGLSPEELGRVLALAPDPELARVALSRVGDDERAREVLAREAVLAVLIRLLGFSTSAADFLVAHPEETAALADLTARPRPVLDDELAGDVARRGAPLGLRLFRRRAMLRVAARDMGGALLEDVVEEISNIADACLAVAAAGVAGSFSVIGLGKLGGRELNYSSDVDLIFIGRGDIAALISLLSEPTAEGIALRVDPTLRPGGRGGVLSRSLDATLDYYATQAATWERQAMIKARPVAGDPSTGREFVERVAEFVYPAELAPSTIDEVRQTKVRLEEYVRARGKESTEVKRGRGGIRDVEFAVQLLQIVHGRRDERLREPNTLRALKVLSDEGYVAADDAEALSGAYRFLRTLEHRLQIVRDLQTHDLPSDSASQRSLARSLGFGGPAELIAEYERQTSLVRGLHERLFYRPLLEAFAGERTPRPGIDRAATQELLAGLGFGDPASACEVFARLVDPSTRLGKVFAHVFPVMAPALALSASPDTALSRLERAAAPMREEPDVADALAGDPIMAQRLANVAAASSFGTDVLVSEPRLLFALGQDARPDSARGDLLLAVARYAAREFAGPSTGLALSAIADRVIKDSLAGASPGGAPPMPFAIVGFGKLGAQELNFASDLDVVFVYEGEGHESRQVAGAAAERVMAGIREAGWEPDADLRPEGRNGPLARSMGAFLEYWQRWAETWEFQALLRARFIAGDEKLGRRFLLNAADFAYPESLPLDHAAEILRMRRRIERERVKPPEAGKFHFKLGYGSLADVQFAVELSLMRHGGVYPQVRKRSTLQAIQALAEARLIEDSTAKGLGDAFVFLSDVKNALEVDRRAHAEALPANPEEQTALARRLGYEEYPRQAFLDDYLRITRRARRAMERVFAGIDE